MGPITVAAVQATPTPGAVGANAELGARLARSAEGARVVVLPELFLSAYHPPTLYRDPNSFVKSTMDDVRLDPLREAARSTQAVLVVGAAVSHEDGRRTCSALVVGTDGTVRVGYDKQNLWGPDERALFSPGQCGATLVVDEWRFGLGVCYDGCFPEHGRAAAADGAHGCLYPSGYLVGSEHRRDVYYAARALDNTMYVVFANSVGDVPPYRFNGGAAVYEPEGRALVRGPNDGEAVVTATLDPAELTRIRATHTMLVDRPAGDGAEREVIVRP